MANSAKYKVAIVGRPNVGKSSLVNRLAQRDEAIVHEKRGVTRDRTYHECDWNGFHFDLVDTGGLEMADDDRFKGDIRTSALAGAEESDVIVFLVDGSVGIQADDEDVARLLKKIKRPIILAVNKLDNPEREEAIWEFMSLGFGEPMPISAVHGHGTGDLLDKIVSYLKDVPEREIDEDEEEDIINVAIIGRPNAGKSTLMNRLTNETRSIVSDVAGTTRDAIDTIVEHNGQRYRLIDTAGIRRKAKIDDNIEYFGYVRAVRAIERADVAVLVIDGTLGVTNEDQRVANAAEEKNCAICIALNKWDAVPEDEKTDKRLDLDEFMQFCSYAPVQSISALKGTRCERIWDSIDLAYANYTRKISVSKLNDFLSNVRETGHTVSAGKTILRMKYMTQTGVKPPTFQIFCNRPDAVTENYKKFINNKMRESFDLAGTPIKIFFRGRS